jgi:tetratricopeptide (TPR) repeat protein
MAQTSGRSPLVASGVLLVVLLLAAGCGGSQSRLAAHMARGQALFAQGDYTKASVEFRNALQISPKNTTARVMAASAAEKLGNLRAALGLYQSAVEDAPDDVDAHAGLARLLILGGAAPRALDVLKPALDKHPDNPELLTLRGAARLVTDRAAATADVQRALQLAPTNEEALALRVRLYQDAGDPAAAVKLLTDALRQLPQSTDLHAILADVYQRIGNSAQAEAQWRTLVAFQPRQQRYRTELALFYTRAHRLDDAQRVLEEAVKATPGSDAVKLELVDFLAAERTPAQAEQALRAFSAAQPEDEDLRLLLGALLQRHGRSEEAQAAYNEVIRREDTGPKGLIARDRLAAMAADQGRDTEARSLLAQVLEKDPRDSDALQLRARLSLAASDPAAAIADLREVLRDQPGAIPAQRMLARAYIANGESALAEGQLRAALDAAADDFDVRQDLAALLMSTHRAGAAVDLLEKGVQLAPDNLVAREALARAYIGKHDWTQAQAAVRDFRQRAPDSAVGFLLEGLVAAGQNRLDDSQHDLEEALKRNPRGFDLLTALTQLDVSRGRMASAIGRTRKALEADPHNALLANLLGELYLAAHAVPEASQALTQAIDLAPRWWVPRRNLARAKLSTGDLAGALADYEAAARLAPAEPQLVFECASLEERQGRIDEALARYQALYDRNPAQRQFAASGLASLLVTYRKDRVSLDRARALTAGFTSTDDGALLDSSGWVSYQRGEFQVALETLERAAQRSPDSKVIHYHVALAELHAGQRERARANLETALAGAPGFTGADNARTLLASLKSGAG